MSKFNSLSDKDKGAIIVAAKATNSITNIASKTLVNKASLSSTQTNKLGNDFIDYVSKTSVSEANTMIPELMNKVLVSQIYKRLMFTDELSKTFMNIQGTEVSARAEIFDNQLLKSHDYDRDKRFPDAQTRAKTLSQILTTIDKKYITNTIPLAGFQAAFARGIGAGQWLANQTKLITESFQVILFERLTPLIDSSVKNVIKLEDNITPEKLLLKCISIANEMEVPSIKYNVGFANPSDAANVNKVRIGISKISDLVMIGNPNIQTNFENVGTVKFHNSFFKVARFNKFIKTNSPKNQLILVDKTAFEGYFRINQTATQTWAGNLTLEMFFHYWIVFGIVPWALGVKFKWDTPSPAPITYDTPEEVVAVDVDADNTSK